MKHRDKTFGILELKGNSSKHIIKRDFGKQGRQMSRRGHATRSKIQNAKKQRGCQRNLKSEADVSWIANSNPSSNARLAPCPKAGVTACAASAETSKFSILFF